jgi:WD40 repeat protein
VLEDDNETSLKSLFKFECDVTEGRQVSGIDINSVNPDLIAVSYGEYDIDSVNELKQGILAFWTLKNPTFPEKIIYWDNSITCCQWSKKQPHLIAIGDSQGNIAVFNIRSDSLAPIADSKDLDGKHTDIIWEIKWVDRDTKGEALVSISGDGRVVEWSMKKGLELTDLTQLKRETNPNQKDVFQSAAADDKEKKAGMTFINTGGMSVDFPIKESGITYYAATEDCSIHMCSTSYPDQYIENYYGHTGPIYKVKCNPFWHPQDCPIFLTCSYDWTVRVWNARDTQAALVCHQIAGEVLRDQVNDIEWSPSTSSCFASVTNDGRVEIWDLKVDTLGPIITFFDTDENDNRIHTPKTIVKFSPTAPVILTGNLNGQVDVYRTKGLEHVQVLTTDQQNRLMGSLKKEDFSSDTKNDNPEE